MAPASRLGVGYILAGTVRTKIEGKPTLLQAGDPVLMPPRTSHNATDLGPETGQMLSTYIAEVGEPIAKGHALTPITCHRPRRWPAS